jgi:hypothetical protein
VPEDTLRTAEGNLFDPLLEPASVDVVRRRLFAERFYRGDLPPMVPVDIAFREKPITHVMALAGTEAAQTLDQNPYFTRVSAILAGRYYIYETAYEREQ